MYQEYFMVANAARLILDECVARGSDLHDLADYAAIQINDTHPTLVIPELIPFSPSASMSIPAHRRTSSPSTSSRRAYAA